MTCLFIYLTISALNRGVRILPAQQDLTLPLAMCPLFVLFLFLFSSFTNFVWMNYFYDPTYLFFYL